MSLDTILCYLTLHLEFIYVDADQAQLYVTSETLQDCTLSSKYQFSSVNCVQSALNTGMQVQRAIGSYFLLKWNCKRLQVQDKPLGRVSHCVTGTGLGDRYERNMRIGPIIKSTVFSHPWKWMLPWFLFIHNPSIHSLYYPASLMTARVTFL